MCPSTLIYNGLGRAAAYGEAATKARGQVRRRESQIFLVSIEPSTVLRGEHSADRGRLTALEGESKQTRAEAIGLGHSSKPQAV